MSLGSQARIRDFGTTTWDFSLTPQPFHEEQEKSYAWNESSHFLNLFDMRSSRPFATPHILQLPTMPLCKDCCILPARKVTGGKEALKNLHVKV